MSIFLVSAYALTVLAHILLALSIALSIVLTVLKKYIDMRIKK